jgi:para-aminobenzoate synthetase component I
VIPLDPSALLALAASFSHLPGTLLLYSGGASDSAQRSILALFPYDRIEIRGSRLWRNGEFQGEGGPWEMWRAEVGERSISGYPEWIGFLGYELGATADPEKQLLPQQAETPDLYLQRSALLLIVDHRSQTGELVIAEDQLERLTVEEQGWVDWFREPSHWTQGFIREERQQSPLKVTQPLQSCSSYVDSVEWTREQIVAGEIYQMCLSQEVRFKGERDPYLLFLELVEKNPAPFSAFLNCGSLSVVSSSPERFLSHRSGRLESRPIKGTAKRGGTALEDSERRDRLLGSEKERAELMMITDLVRNDLGRVSIPGSVRVDELRRCEGYANVFHTLSVVSSQARPELHPVDLVRFCFPPGSITGCPKLRAMELIAEVEGRARGPYCGAIGYFCGNGDFDLSVAIRLLEFKGEEIRCQIGGAIGVDSEAHLEYEETLHKGETLLQVISS